MNLGELIRQTRKARNMTQEELELLTGVTTRTISKIESGKYSVILDKVVSLLHALGATKLEVHFGDADGCEGGAGAVGPLVEVAGEPGIGVCADRAGAEAD